MFWFEPHQPNPLEIQVSFTFLIQNFKHLRADQRKVNYEILQKYCSSTICFVSIINAHFCFLPMNWVSSEYIPGYSHSLFVKFADIFPWRPEKQWTDNTQQLKSLKIWILMCTLWLKLSHSLVYITWFSFCNIFNHKDNCQI